MFFKYFIGGEKMTVVINKDKCTGCGECINVCLVEAIKLIDNIAVVNENECISCGACISSCPNDAISF